MAASPASDQPDREVLAGIIERVTFRNADNGLACCGSRHART
jgi:hypothetical protein